MKTQTNSDLLSFTKSVAESAEAADAPMPILHLPITVGDTNYAHEMSAFFLRSGLKISIENDNNIKDSEFREISQYILSNKPFIRQLMTLGFDTLIVTGKTSRKGMQYCLKSYTQLGGFSLE